MATRQLTLTVALDWPTNAAESRVFTDALAAEFKSLGEARLEGPHLTVGVCVRSNVLAGNTAIPRIWRRLLRFLQNARVISPASDPWCTMARVEPVPDYDSGPYVTLRLEDRR